MEVTVQGEATRRVAPTEGDLQVVVEASAGSQAEAFAAAGRLAQQVDSAIAACPAVLAVVPGMLGTRSTVDPTSRRRSWQASRSQTVVLRPESGPLGNLVAALALDGVRLAGPVWRVADGDPAWDDLRRTAVGDARRRAAAYADGLGIALGAVKSVREQSARTSAPVAGVVRTRGAVEAQGPGLDVSADPVPASVTVEVTFALEG